MKKLIIGLLLMPLLVSAAGLELEQLNTCELQYAGESCVVELNLTNNVEAMTVKATSTIQYSGQCGESWDGIGIVSKINNKVLDTELDIVSGLNQLQYKIETSPGLCPGEYSFQLQVGYEKEVVASVSSGGGGGGWRPSPPQDPPETSEMNEEEELMKKIIEILKKLITLYQQLIAMIELQ